MTHLLVNLISLGGDAVLAVLFRDRAIRVLYGAGALATLAKIVFGALACPVAAGVLSLLALLCSLAAVGRLLWLWYQHPVRRFRRLERRADRFAAWAHREMDAIKKALA